MPHPITRAAAERLTAAEQKHAQARQAAFRAWGPKSVAAASEHAHRILGDEAADLEWKPLGVLRSDEHLQAVASLGTVAGQHLKLYYSGEGSRERIVLRTSCETCGSQQAHEVTSLEHLGRLLSRMPVWQHITAGNGGAR